MRNVLAKSVVLSLFAVCLLAAGAAAQAGDLAFVKDPSTATIAGRRGLYFYQFGKAKDAKAAGLVSPRAVVASAYGGPAVRIAIDSTKPDAAQPDVVRLDFSGQGKFAGAPAVALTIKTDSGGQITGTVGPTVVLVESGGRKVPVFVQGLYTKRDRYRNVQATVTVAAEGTCAFGKVTRKVRVIDGNADLVFSATLKPPYRPSSAMYYDLLQVAGADGKFTINGPQAYVGQPVFVDGKWYETSVSSMKISTKLMADQGGNVCVNARRWRCTLVGQKYFLAVSGGKDPVAVPADTYRSHRYTVFSGADPNKRCAMIYGYGTAAGGKALTVPAGKTVDLPIGAPVQAAITARKSSGRVQINLSQTDPLGGQIADVTGEGGKKPANPVVDVVDKAGKTVYSAKLEYG